MKALVKICLLIIAVLMCSARVNALGEGKVGPTFQLTYSQEFKNPPDPAGPSKNLAPLKLLGAYDIAIDRINNRLFVTSTVSHSLTSFSLANSGKPVALI